MQFYILMIDYGKRRPTEASPSGFEAVCNPELTRREVVEQARDALKRHEVAFVKFIDGNYCEDITAEILDEARAGMLEAAE